MTAGLKKKKWWLRIFIEKHNGEKTGNSLQQLWKERITEVCVHHKSCRKQKFNQGGFRHIKPSFLRGGQENISAPLLGPCPTAFLLSHSVPGTPWTSTGTGFLTASSGCWHACGDPSSWPYILSWFSFQLHFGSLGSILVPNGCAFMRSVSPVLDPISSVLSFCVSAH